MNEKDNPITKLYKSRKYVREDYWRKVVYKSDVVDVARELIETAERKGLNVSRWETNSPDNSFVKFITWAVHEGERTEKYQELGGRCVAKVHLNHSEGTTSRCQAYRKLRELVGEVEGWEREAG